MSLAFNEQNRLLFIQMQALPPIMHHKWIEIIDYECKTTNAKSSGSTPDKISHLVKG